MSGEKINKEMTMWKLVEKKEDLKDFFDKEIPLYTKAMVDQEEIIPINTLKLAEAMIDLNVEIVYKEGE